LLGATISAVLALSLPNDNESVAGNNVEDEVLVILVAIMVINFVVLKQAFVERNVRKITS
jgi:hypothetical protein